MIKRWTFNVFLLASCIALLSVALGFTAHSNEKAGKTQVLFSKADNGEINVQIKGGTHQKIQLYLFNASGQLVHTIESKPSNQIILHDVEHGQYLYQCFENDVELKSGNLLVYKNKIDYD